MNGSLPTGASAPTAGGGGDESGGGAGFRTLRAAYLYGLANDPDVDNVLPGSYFDIDFDDDGHIGVLQNTIDDGSGADANSPIRVRRWFSNSAAAGLVEDYRTRYSDGALAAGGMQQKFTIEDADGDARLYATYRMGLLTGSVNTYFRPTFAGGAVTAEQLDLIGLHQDTVYAVHGRDGNGVSWQRAQLTDSARELFARVLQMDSEGGGNPPDGSIVSDAVTGPSSSIGLGTQLSRIRTVLDEGNFGSEQADTHLELMAASIELAGIFTGLAVYADHIEVPGHAIVGTHLEIGDYLDVAGDTDIAGELSLMGGPVPVVGVTATFDFLTTGTYAISLPTVAGKSALVQATRFVCTSKTGAATGTLTYGVGNNVGVDNMAAGVGVTAAGFNAIAAPNSVAGFSSGGVVPANATFSLNVTAGFGGASVMQGYFVLSIWYV